MLISIIIPCYNSERFIAATLDMLLEQNLSDCEIIVVNDGSTDRTVEIVEEYVKENTNIKLISQNNKGVSVARNVGLNEASGKFIYFLDSDDSLAEGTLDFFRSVLYENKTCNIFCFGYETIQNGKVLKKYISEDLNNCILNKQQLNQSFFLKKLFIHICSSIYEHKFLKEHSIYFMEGVKIGEDVEFILRSILNSSNLFYSSRICFKYQIRDDSAMQGYKVYHKEKTWISNKLIIDELGSKEYQQYYNYWLRNRYIGKLYDYLKLGKKEIDTRNAFFETRYFLSLPTKNFGRVYLLSEILRRVPMKFLFFLFNR